jgi:hypothetical protein
MAYNKLNIAKRIAEDFFDMLDEFGSTIQSEVKFVYNSSKNVVQEGTAITEALWAHIEDGIFNASVDAESALNKSTLNEKAVANNILAIEELAVNVGIDVKIQPTSNKFYDFAGSSGAYSAGKIDGTKAFADSITAGVNTATITNMNSGLITDFVAGMEVTIQDTTNKEVLIIDSVADPVITFKTNIQNSYLNGANIYRSNIKESNGFFEPGDFESRIVNVPLLDTGISSWYFQTAWTQQDIKLSNGWLTCKDTGRAQVYVSKDNLQTFEPFFTWGLGYMNYRQLGNKILIVESLNNDGIVTYNIVDIDDIDAVTDYKALASTHNIGQTFTYTRSESVLINVSDTIAVLCAQMDDKFVFVKFELVGETLSVSSYVTAGSANQSSVLNVFLRSDGVVVALSTDSSTTLSTTSVYAGTYDPVTNAVTGTDTGHDAITGGGTHEASIRFVYLTPEQCALHDLPSSIQANAEIYGAVIEVAKYSDSNLSCKITSANDLSGTWSLFGDNETQYIGASLEDADIDVAVDDNGTIWIAYTGPSSGSGAFMYLASKTIDDLVTDNWTVSLNIDFPFSANNQPRFVRPLGEPIRPIVYATSTTSGYLYASGEFEYAPKALLLSVDARLNVTPFDTVKDIAGYITMKDVIGSDVQAELSIVQSIDDESYVAISEAPVDLGAKVEFAIFGGVATPGDKVALKLGITRTDTADDLEIETILGGVS